MVLLHDRQLYINNIQYTQKRKKLTCLGLLIFLTIFLILSNTMYLHRRPCNNNNNNNIITTTTTTTITKKYINITPDSPSIPPIHTKSYIFIKQQNLITKLISNSNISKTSIDLLLNIRKLTLFAVHELNHIVGCGSSSSSSVRLRVNCTIKWWTNPLNTIALKTIDYSPHYIDHDITFIGEPENTPIWVRIRQYNITSQRNELEIKGKYYRLDGEIISIPKLIDGVNYTTNTGGTIEEEMMDPELITWKRDSSFFVSDYIDFKNINIYKISPGSPGGEKINNNMTDMTVDEDLYCGSKLKMLVMISSAPNHFEQRRTIRETYGSHKNLNQKHVRLVFLFGMVKDRGLQGFLNEEANKHDDIIQVDFMDSYHNLTLSHLSMYNWIRIKCEKYGLPKYVLKADDDFFLNIDLALRVAYENPNYELIGVPYCGTKPVRNTAYMTKYYTPRYMYMADLYVGYLSGVAYIFRTDIIPRILQVSLTTPIIHMDDVYMTGLVARQLNFIPMGSKLFTYGRSDLNPCDIKKMVSSYALSIEDMRAQWNEWIKPIPINCSLTSIESLIPINPFRPQDMIGCVLQ